MKKKFILFYLLLVIAISFTFYRGWFAKGYIAAHDQNFFPAGFYHTFYFPSLWQSFVGVGGLVTPVYTWLPQQVIFYIFGHILKYDHNLIFRLTYCFPIIFVGSFSILYCLYKLTRNIYASFVSSIFFLTNTFALGRVSAGQYSILLANVLIPLVFINFYLYLNDKDKNLKYLLWSAFFFSFQGYYDIRVVYITLLMLAVYFFIYGLEKLVALNFKQAFKEIIFSSFKVFFFFGLVFVLLHNFWFVPLHVLGADRGIPFPKDYDTDIWMNYYSLNKIYNTFSVRNTIWPSDNLSILNFPEPFFAVFPLVVVLCTFFFVKKRKSGIFMFSLVTFLAGIFLTKGIQPPFGELFRKMFFFFPGFKLFREPSKFEIMATFSFSVILLIFIDKILKSTQKNILISRILIPAVVLIFVAMPSLIGYFGPDFDKNSGLLTREYPSSYQKLESFFAGEERLFRVLWVPKIPRFGYFAEDHPFLNYYDLHFNGLNLFRNSYDTGILEDKDYFFNLIKILNIKYIVVPEETKGDIFAYDNVFRKDKILNQLRENKHLKEFKKIGENYIFTLKEDKEFFPKIYPGDIGGLEILDKFTKKTEKVGIKFQKMSPTAYYLRIENLSMPIILNFSERFHKGWKILELKDSLFDCTVKYKYERDDFIVEECERGNELVRKEYFSKFNFSEAELAHQEKNFLNVWTIGEQYLKKDNKSSSTFLIFFKPQREFLIGIFVTFLTILVFVLKSVTAYVKQRKK